MVEEQKGGLIILQQSEDVTEEQAKLSEKTTLEAMLEKSDMFNKLGRTPANFLSMFNVLVDGVRVTSLSDEVATYQKVVILPVIVGG